MKPIVLDDLNLMIARAKSSGEIIWYQVKSISSAVYGTEINQQAYDHFAGMCDAYAKEFEDKQLGELLALEMFLRAGKRMTPDAKRINRAKADALKETILRRKQ